MSRRHRKGRSVHGILLLDKPEGGSSNQALQRVKRLFQAKKAGHTGSLDPLATGMLPICLGEATKVSGFLLDADKGYETTLRLGVTTSSLDSDGDVLETRPVPADLTRERFVTICERFTGPQQQVPPMVSAIRIDGQRLYRLARDGVEVDRPARPIIIRHLQVMDFDGTTARLAVRCSKGTYIRSLVADIGEAVGCGAHVQALRRTFVAPFEGYPMVTIEALEEMALTDPSALDEWLLPLDAGLLHLPACSLENEGLAHFRCGQSALVTAGRKAECYPLPASGHVPGGGQSAPGSSLCRVYDASGLLVGLGETNTSAELVAPRRVFQID